VLDIGTASGFLAFAAEQAGASSVTSIDVASAAEYQRLPFAGTLYQTDRRSGSNRPTQMWKDAGMRSGTRTKNTTAGSIELLLKPLAELPFWERRFDVVFLGAIIEHLADPISAIGSAAILAREKIIIAFTEILDSDDIIMQAHHAWDSPAADYTWWRLSRGLYRRVLANCGFSMRIEPCTALALFAGGVETTRHTIVATRS
jgi:hypothetical protein